ncbi:MAG: Asp-tRNA(Asn)/Glu-tRNA(Gln) amidotransferase subunit GatA [Clostridia bacterium]|nr:Asp-tRNA(Asn)/Glu-tRNA(Gln) amidotransferase subunit GatA [Clostridia bacterium]
MRLCERTAHDLRGMLVRGEVTSREITESVLDQIGKVEEKIGAYLTITPEQALAQADAADARIRAEQGNRCGGQCGGVGRGGDDATGQAPGILGIPVAMKDNICTRGIRTTCGSRMLENFVPPYDATVVKKLRDAGAVIIGKTNMDEFAMGSSTENSAFHITRNPWDCQRVPGGSSGGSAAAVAAGEAIMALGTDTGGSVREPASFCGVVGVKPTYGRVSRYGVVAFGSSLDQVGPLAKDVEDAALLLGVLAGLDGCDSTSVPKPVPNYASALDRGIKGLSIGVPTELFGAGLDPRVRKLVEDGISAMEGRGARTVQVSMPHAEYALAAYYIVATAEASSNLARFDGVRYGHRAAGSEDITSLMKRSRSEGFGAEVKRRIMLGTYALSSGYYEAYYAKAMKARTLLKRDLEAAFEICDVLVSPTVPFLPFKIGEKFDDPLSMYLADVYTTTANLTGVPAISVPCGLSDGLPVGIHLVGRLFDEETLFSAARALEEACGVARMRPPAACGCGDVEEGRNGR